MSDLTLEELDQDGAFSEAFDRMHGESRADFLRKAVIGGGALLAALSDSPPAAAGTSSDVAILNFDLSFEYMQASFYTEAESVGTVARMSPKNAAWARTFGAHERAHVKVLQNVLGRDAVKKPFFNFRGVTEDESAFTRTVVAFEDLTTALLTGQVPRLRSRGLVSALFSLLTVEARHAAWVRHALGLPPVGAAFDEPTSMPEVQQIVASTNFFGSRPLTRTMEDPPFTG